MLFALICGGTLIRFEALDSAVTMPPRRMGTRGDAARHRHFGWRCGVLGPATVARLFCFQGVGGAFEAQHGQMVLAGGAVSFVRPIDQTIRHIVAHGPKSQFSNQPHQFQTLGALFWVFDNATRWCFGGWGKFFGLPAWRPSVPLHHTHGGPQAKTQRTAQCPQR